MAALVSCTAQSLVALTATFDVQMDADSLLPHLWSVYPVGQGAEAAVVKAALQPGGLVAALLVSPRLSAGEAYEISADYAKTAAGQALNPNDKVAAFGVNAGLPSAAQKGFPHGLRPSFLEAVGEEAQYLAGRPTTMLVSEFPQGAPVVLVESTLGFPKAGKFWLDGRRYAYASKTPASFKGVQPEFPEIRGAILPRSLVQLDLASAPVQP